MKIKRPLHFMADPAAEPNGEPSGDGSQEPNGGGGGSVLSQQSANDFEFMPEKFRTFDGEGDDAKFNLQNSSTKMAEAYSNLEKMAGDKGFEAPPESSEEYKLDTEKFGEDFKIDEFMDDDSTKGFLKRMHAKGINNSQIQEIVEYGLLEWAPSMLTGNQSMTNDEVMEDLKGVWKSDQETNKQLGLASKGLKSFIDPHDIETMDMSGYAEGTDPMVAMMDKYGNDPVLLRMLARIGKESQEDQQPNPDAALNGSSIEELMAHPAYSDSKHPEHKKVSAQIKSYYEAKHGTEAAA